jgi:tripeptidyl-peptidase-1
LRCHVFSAGGRGIPDLASQAHRLGIFIYEELYITGGTSCSTPVRLFLFIPYALRRPSSSTQLTANVQTVSGIISLLNDYLISTDRRPLGFLNIWLYDRGFAGLNDITSGTNSGCNTEGFSAVTGWDPVRRSKHSLRVYFD